MKTKFTGLFVLFLFVVLSCMLVAVLTVGKDFASKDPVSIEAKIETGILIKAMERKKIYDDKQNNMIGYLVEKLTMRGIYSVFYRDIVTDEELIGFINELLVDTESQKIFRKFSENHILIGLSNAYKTEGPGGSVDVDVRDGVKKVAEWLSG